jgi:hypothetical protein
MNTPLGNNNMQEINLNINGIMGNQAQKFQAQQQLTMASTF